MSEDSDDERKNAPANPGGEMKFDELMKAAVSIKTSQLAQKKKFFESLPTFLQAGVYYTKKLSNVRKQRFNQKLFVHEILKHEGGKAFADEDFNRACRKYEEALWIWRYYYWTNSNWEQEGIDDRELKHYEAIGDNSNEIFKIRDIKIKLYLNISICSIKMKEFPTSLRACEEALKLDTKNIKGYYLKARSRILDINSGVDDLKLAVRDLKEGLKIDPTNKPIINQLQKILKLVNINSKREKETYLNMFDKNNSVEEYVKKTIKEEVAKTRREEEKMNRAIVTPNHKNKDKFEKKIQKYIKAKELEFSFEVKKEREKFPEIEEIRETITKGEEAIDLYAKTGRIAEARQLKTSLQQARYEIEMLDCVMNLDFTKPRAKAKEMALEMGIDLTDPVVIGEFQKIQNERLKELRAVKDGKKKSIEKKADIDREDFNDVFRESNRAVVDRSTEEVKDESQEESKEETKEIVENTDHNDVQINQQPQRKLEDEEDEHSFNPKTVIIWAILCLWLSSLCYLFAFRT